MSKQFSMYGLWDKKDERRNDNFTLSYTIPIKCLVYNANCPQCDIPFNTDNEDYRFCPKCGRIEYNKKP